MESDTCLVVVTVFKIVASALCVGGWVRFPPSPPAFARAFRLARSVELARLAHGKPASSASARDCSPSSRAKAIMKSSRLRAIPSVDKILQSLGDTGFQRPWSSTRCAGICRRCDRRRPIPAAPTPIIAGIRSSLQTPACVPHHAGDQRHRDPGPHQSRPRAARPLTASARSRRSAPTTAPSNTVCATAPAAAARRISNTRSRFCAAPRPRRSSTTTPRRWC